VQLLKGAPPGFLRRCGAAAISARCRRADAAPCRHSAIQEMSSSRPVPKMEVRLTPDPRATRERAKTQKGGRQMVQSTAVCAAGSPPATYQGSHKDAGPTGTPLSRYADTGTAIMITEYAAPAPGEKGLAPRRAVRATRACVEQDGGMEDRRRSRRPARHSTDRRGTVQGHEHRGTNGVDRGALPLFSKASRCAGRRSRPRPESDRETVR
jgi:hypothetical protein